MKNLTAVAKDANGNNISGADYDWKSKNTSVATVNSEGKVTAVAEGETEITVKAEKNGGEASAKVSVTVRQRVSRVSVSPSSTTLNSIGETKQLSATAEDARGNTVSGATIAWSSSDSTVATVSLSGLVTAKTIGTATITASASKDGVSASGTASVTVRQRVASVEVSPSTTTLSSIGDTESLSAAVKDANGNAISGATIAWSSNDETVATVSSSGLVTAKANGTATITAEATAPNDNVSASGTASVTVLSQLASVEVSPASTTLSSIGATESLTAMPKDTNGSAISGATIAWSSSDATVATVSSDGLVTAIGNGTASITVTASKGSITAEDTASVTVSQRVARVEVSPDSTTLRSIDDTVQLSATAMDANGNAISGATIAWSSSDATEATVSSDGLVTAIGEGTATITATATKDDISAEGTASVTVRPQVASVEVSPSSSVLSSIGDTDSLTVVVKDANGHAISGVTIAWSSSDATVATVSSDGLVTAIGEGTATITATASKYGGSASGTATVTVRSQVASVEVSPDSTTLHSIGDTESLTAVAKDANGHAISGATIAWSSSDETVATVSSAGLVTAIGDGTATITAAASKDGVSAEGMASVTVRQRVASVEMSPSSTTFHSIDDTESLTVAVKDANGHAISGATITWSSSDETVATVSLDGLVTAIGDGTATITGTATRDGVSAEGTASVTVRQRVYIVDVEPGLTTLFSIGDTVSLTAVAKDANDNAIAGATYVWSVEDERVATVSSDGLVTAISEGKAVIRVSASKDGVSTVHGATVLVRPWIASVEISPSSTTLSSIGDTESLTAVAKDANGNAVSGATIAWSSSNERVATVSSDGLVTAIGRGRATITATGSKDGFRLDGTTTVTVLRVHNVVLSPSSTTLSSIGATDSLTAVVRDPNGNVESHATITWLSSDQTVATVSTTGLVTAKSEGTATITASATVAGVTVESTATATVRQQVASVEVSPPATTLTYIGATGSLTATARDANGYAVSGAIITWLSSDASVATVSSAGLVTAIGDGTATITASASKYGVRVENVAVVTVKEVPLPTGISLSVSPSTWVENAGNTTVTVTATPVGGLFRADQTVTVSVAGSGVAKAVGFTTVEDFGVTIAAGSSSGSGTFTLVPVPNSVVNVDETITVSGTVSPSTVSVTLAALTLTDDDVPTTVPRDPPGNAIVLAGDGSLNLSWQPVAGATSYEYKYMIEAGGFPNPWPWKDLGSSTNFTIPDLENHKTYIVLIRTRNNIGTGSLIQLMGTPRPRPGPQDILPVPENLTSSAGNGSISVNWSPIPGASSYQIQYRVNYTAIPDPWPWSATNNATSHTLTGLKNGTPYIVRVRGVNAAGVGGKARRTRNSPRNPSVPDVSISKAKSRVDEGESVAFSIAASFAPAESLTVNLSMSRGEAFLTGSVPTNATIVPGQTSTTVTLLTEDDVVDEPNGYVTARVASGDGYNLGAYVAQVYINDNDEPPTGIALSVSPQAVSEADSAAIVTVKAAPTGGTRYAMKQTVTVSIAGSDAAHAVDFEQVEDFVVTIPAGGDEGSANFELTPVDNTANNADETITVSGTGPAGVSVSSATLTLTDDDVPVVTITAAADSVVEGASAAFTVAASPAPYATLMVNISVSGGTGYLSDSTPDSVVVIGADITSKSLSLGTDDDETDERHAAVSVSVQSGAGYVVGQDGSARVVIKDDELPESAPAEPGNLLATPGDRQVTLSWSSSARATWYEVQYRAVGDPTPDPWPWTDIGNVTRYTIDGLENGTNYQFQLRALNELGSSSVVNTSATPSGTSARKLARTVAPAAPAVLNVLDDITLETGDMRTLDVAATFTGDGLTYSASSTDADVASATMTDGSMTVSGLTRGTTTLTVTARNGAGSAGYALSVTVTAGAAERAAYENVLAAMGRGILSSARATMEDRFSALGGQRHLSLSGRRVDGVATGVSALVGLAGYHIPQHWNDQIVPVSAGNADILRSSSFIYTLPGYGSARGTGGVTIWGTGNVQAFRSSPSGLRYDGGLRTGYAGVDITMRGLVAGLSVSRTAGTGDFQAPGIQGEMSTRLTGVYPYAHWRSTSRPLEVWSILGAGRGEAVAAGESRYLSMRMAMMGLRARWMDLAGLGLSVVGHAGALSLTAPSPGGQGLGDLNAGVRQIRLGLEGSARGFGLGPSRLSPFAQVAGRYDGGAGESGSGLEVAGGLRLAAGRLGIEARGRMLAAHTASSYRERGLSLMVYVRPVTGRGGLSVSLAPRWGHDTRTVDMTWKDDAVGVSERRQAEQAGGVRAQVGYSIRYPALSGLVVTPFGEADLSASDRRLMRLGTRMGSQEGLMSLELVGEHRQDRAGDDHRVGLLARMRF